MGIEESRAVDPCERAIRTALYQESELSRRDRRHLRKALRWYRPESECESPLSLIECLAIARLTGDELLIRLDYGDQYKYLDFDTRNDRIVLAEPDDGNPLPIEETDLHNTFEQVNLSFVSRGEMAEKTVSAVTVVSHPDIGTKVVLGRYPDSFERYTDDGDLLTYSSKAIFTLPEPMSPDEVLEWIESDAGQTVQQVIEQNAEREWTGDLSL